MARFRYTGTCCIHNRARVPSAKSWICKTPGPCRIRGTQWTNPLTLIHFWSFCMSFYVSVIFLHRAVSRDNLRTRKKMFTCWCRYTFIANHRERQISKLGTPNTKVTSTECPYHRPTETRMISILWPDQMMECPYHKSTEGILHFIQVVCILHYHGFQFLAFFWKSAEKKKQFRHYFNFSVLVRSHIFLSGTRSSR